MTDHPINILFVSPKCGGILQCSGFLDLKSLMALGQTCKANMIDELSIIQLIENEITRDHGVKTMEEAISFWRQLYRENPIILKQWLERDYSSSSNDAEKVIRVTHDMLADATRGRGPVPYDVMLGKMLRTIPTQAKRFQQLREQDIDGRTLLHYAGESGCLESLKAILAIYPESERIQAVSVEDVEKRTVLHCAALSGNAKSIKLILALYPESERLQAVNTHDTSAQTVLHFAARSGSREALEFVLSLHPCESERLRAVRMQNDVGQTSLHLATLAGDVNCVEAVLSLYPEAERLHAVSMQDEYVGTVLHGAARSGNLKSFKTVLALYPESEHLRAVSMQDKHGDCFALCCRIRQS